VFEGFAARRITTRGAQIHAVLGGSGRRSSYCTVIRRRTCSGNPRVQPSRR
jgi:hypothetical protein